MWKDGYHSKTIGNKALILVRNPVEAETRQKRLGKKKVFNLLWQETKLCLVRKFHLPFHACLLRVSSPHNNFLVQMQLERSELGSKFQESALWKEAHERKARPSVITWISLGMGSLGWHGARSWLCSYIGWRWCFSCCSAPEGLAASRAHCSP